MSTPKDGKPAPSEPLVDSPTDPPPILKTWKTLYIVVLVQLVIMIVSFYFFTKLFE